MGYVLEFPSGGILADIRRAMHASSASIDGLTVSPGGDDRVQGDDGGPIPPDPYAGEARWPAWKVTVAVVVFCGAFWTAVGYLVVRLFG